MPLDAGTGIDEITRNQTPGSTGSASEAQSTTAPSEAQSEQFQSTLDQETAAQASASEAQPPPAGADQPSASDPAAAPADPSASAADPSSGTSANGSASGIGDAANGTIDNVFDAGEAIGRLNSDGDRANLSVTAEGKVLVPVPTEAGLVPVGGKAQYGYNFSVTQVGDADPATNQQPSYDVTFSKNLLAGVQAETPKGVLPSGTKAGLELNLGTADSVTMRFDSKQDAERALGILQRSAQAEALRDAAAITDPSLSNPAANPQASASGNGDGSGADYVPGGELNPATHLYRAADRVAPTAEEQQFLTDHVTSYTQTLTGQERARFEAKLGALGIEPRLDGNVRLQRTVEVPQDGENGRVSYALEGEMALTAKEKLDFKQSFMGGNEIGLTPTNIADIGKVTGRVELAWDVPPGEMPTGPGGRPVPELDILNDGRALHPDELSVQLRGEGMAQSPLDPSRTDLVRGELNASLRNPDGHAADLFNGLLDGDVEGALSRMPQDASLSARSELVRRDGTQTQPEIGIRIDGVGEAKASMILNAGNDDVVARSERRWSGSAPPAAEPAQPEEPAQPPPQEPEQLVVVPHDGLNLRSAPGTDSPKTGVFQHGTFLQPTGREAQDASGQNWKEVTGLDDRDRTTTGWVSGNYVEPHAAGAMDDAGRINPDLAAQGYRAVTVQPGDTVTSIAQANGADPQDAVALNKDHLIDPNLIFPGDKVYIPGTAQPAAPPQQPEPQQPPPQDPPPSGSDESGSSDSSSEGSGSASGDEPSAGEPQGGSPDQPSASEPQGGSPDQPSASEPSDDPSASAPSDGSTPTEPGTTTGRPDLDRVLHDYQVAQDPGGKTDFTPHVLFVPIESKKLEDVTATEARLLGNLGLGELSTMNDAVTKAREVSTERFPDPAGGVPPGRDSLWLTNDGHRDAFRHVYWNALMSKNLGNDFAEQYGTAHEAIPEADSIAEREAMDLYNNEVGRRIAQENPDASDEELAQICYDAVMNGDAVIIDADGDLAWSDQVPVWQHGEARSPALPGQLPVPNGDASAS